MPAKRKKTEKQEPYKADYQGATPEQVARAVLNYRPKPPHGSILAGEPPKAKRKRRKT